MGSFYTGCKVENHKDPKRSAVVPRLLVDTRRAFTWLPAEVLEHIGVQPVKKDLRIQVANGTVVTRSVGYAILRVNGFEITDEVVFGEKSDRARLGWRAMGGMNLRVDRQKKELVAAEPIVAA